MSTVNHTGYNEFSDSSKAAKSKRRIPSLAAAGDSQSRLIDILASLELLPSTGIVEPLKQLAAAKKPLGDFVKISVYELDQALADVQCSVAERITLKSALHKAGMLSTAK
jgi:hypothetical protein